MGRSLFAHPALSVAYPKSFTPSVVSWVSLPPGTSRTHRFQSRMNAACFPSGEVTVVGGDAAPPPRPPRPLVAGDKHAGSVHRSFVPVAASTRIASVPVAVV